MRDRGNSNNTLEIITKYPHDAVSSVGSQYAFAIEVIVVQNYDTILAQCQGRLISREMSLGAILKYRSSKLDNIGDITVRDATTNITIYDPICQSEICKLPARGEGCRHRECFDLENFLQTRPRNPPSWSSEPNAWKYPICLGDARPHRIVIDGFLNAVRDQLVLEGREQTRAIIINADGQWEPKLDPNISGVRTKSTITATATASLGSTSAVGKRAPLIIDLCDED